MDRGFKKKGMREDKRGVKFLGEHVVNIIVAVLVVVILAFLVYKMVFIWDDGNKLESAGESLEGIVSKIEVVNSESVEGKIIVFPPENWFLMTFPDYDFPVGECFKENSCLCICDSVSCSGSKKCEGFGFDVEVDSVYGEFAGVSLDGVSERKLKGVLKLSSSEELIIVKEENVVLVRRVENGA